MESEDPLEVKKLAKYRLDLANVQDVMWDKEGTCCHSAQSLLSSSLLSKNVKIKIHRNIILPVILYGFETWSLTLREKHMPRMFEHRLLRRIFGHKRNEVTGK